MFFYKSVLKIGRLGWVLGNRRSTDSDLSEYSAKYSDVENEYTENWRTTRIWRRDRVEPFPSFILLLMKKTVEQNIAETMMKKEYVGQNIAEL